MHVLSFGANQYVDSIPGEGKEMLDSGSLDVNKAPILEATVLM